MTRLLPSDRLTKQESIPRQKVSKSVVPVLFLFFFKKKNIPREVRIIASDIPIPSWVTQCPHTRIVLQLWFDCIIRYNQQSFMTQMVLVFVSVLSVSLLILESPLLSLPLLSAISFGIVSRGLKLRQTHTLGHKDNKRPKQAYLV